MRLIASALLVLVCLGAQAQQEREPVYQLLDMIGSKDQMQNMSSQFVNVIISSDPSLKPYKDVIQDWSDKYLDWDALRDDIAEIYRKHYSTEEIEKLITFYQTPVGQKTIELMPQLMQEGSQVGMRQAQKHQAELKEMIEEAQAASQNENAPAADAAPAPSDGES